MKKKQKDNADLVIIAIIALAITTFVMFSIDGSDTHITGNTAGDGQSVSDVIAVYFTLFLIAAAIALVFAAEHVLKKKYHV